MLSKRLVAVVLSVLAALALGMGTSAPAAAQSTATYRAELNQLMLDMRALWGEIERFEVQPRYCLPPGTPNKAPDQAVLDALEGRVNALNARYNRTKQGLDDFLANNTRLYGELLANGVDPRDRRWWTSYETSRKKMVDELRAKKAALALKREINCSPPPPPNTVVATAPPAPLPLPLRPAIDPLGWPAMPPHFCSWADYWKFITGQINPRYNKVAENAEKAARFRTQVEVQVNNLVQAGKPIPAALAVLRRQAIADVAEQNRLFKESEEIYRRAKAIPVIDCRPPTQPGTVTAPPASEPAATSGPRFQSGSPLDDKRNRLFAIVEEMEAANDRCDPEAYERLLNELREMRSQVKLAAAAATGSAEFSNVNPREAEGLADAIREVIRPREWQLLDLKRKCRNKTQAQPPPTAPSQTGFIPPPGSAAARMLEVHNRERAAVGVPSLQWDPQLAASASAYAAKLAAGGPFVHAPRAGRENERENLSRGLPGASPERMMLNWTNEKSNFIPGIYPNVSKTGSWYDVSHYTQMIWPTTTRVGCGTARGAGQEVLVCRYTPPGNRPGRPILADNVRLDARELSKLSNGGGMQQIDPPAPPPPPLPTAADNAPDGNEARHPLATLFANALNRHYEALRNCDRFAADRALSDMSYALGELRKRLKAVRTAGGFSTVNPDELQRLIDGLERVLRGAELRSQTGTCPPR